MTGNLENIEELIELASGDSPESRNAAQTLANYYTKLFEETGDTSYSSIAEQWKSQIDNSDEVEAYSTADTALNPSASPMVTYPSQMDTYREEFCNGDYDHLSIEQLHELARHENPFAKIKAAECLLNGSADSIKSSISLLNEASRYLEAYITGIPSDTTNPNEAQSRIQTISFLAKLYCSAGILYTYMAYHTALENERVDYACNALLNFENAYELDFNYIDELIVFYTKDVAKYSFPEYSKSRQSVDTLCGSRILELSKEKAERNKSFLACYEYVVYCESFANIITEEQISTAYKMALSSTDIERCPEDAAIIRAQYAARCNQEPNWEELDAISRNSDVACTYLGWHEEFLGDYQKAQDYWKTGGTEISHANGMVSMHNYCSERYNEYIRKGEDESIYFIGTPTDLLNVNHFILFLFPQESKESPLQNTLKRAEKYNRAVTHYYKMCRIYFIVVAIYAVLIALLYIGHFFEDFTSTLFSSGFIVAIVGGAFTFIYTLIIAALVICLVAGFFYLIIKRPAKIRYKWSFEQFIPPIQSKNK